MSCLVSPKYYLSLRRNLALVTSFTVYYVMTDIEKFRLEQMKKLVSVFLCHRNTVFKSRCIFDPPCM